MPVFAIDVSFSDSFPVGPEPDGFRTFLVEACTGGEAELIACQMTAARRGRTPVASCVLLGTGPGDSVAWSVDIVGRRGVR